MPFKTFKALVQSNGKVPGNTPLGCLLRQWKSAGFYQDLDKRKMLDYCNHWWLLYASEGGPEWPLNGTLDTSVITPLMQYLRENEKWDEIPYLDLFYYLGQKTEWQKECGIMVLKVEDNQDECSGCKARKVCVKCAVKTPGREEDLSLLIAPPSRPVPSAPPLPRERSEQEQEELGTDTDEDEDERETTHFDDSLGSHVEMQAPANSNSQTRSPI